jgi:hypothetical protein
MIYIEESLKKFNELPEEVMLTIDNEKIAAIIDELNEKYKVNLYPLLIYVTVGDIGDAEMPGYLKREFQASDENAKNIIQEFSDRILAPIMKRVLFLSADESKPLFIVDEKKLIIEIFEEKLVEEIMNHPLIIEAVNSRIFWVLAKSLDFRGEIEKAIYANNEKLTHKKFVIDGKEHSPSISNWLKYFIKLKGTSLYDNVLISSFVTESENAKRLEPDEKKLLYRLLLLYRNLKFFPESMPSDDGTGWEIIPVEKEEKASLVVKGLPDKKGGRESLIDELKGTINDYPEGSLEREILEEEDEKDQEYHKLLLLSKKYPEGSLERRAVEEEMRRLKS